ncbi:MAG: FAD-dependent oxidoreductase [Calditerrivibrio sp.]|uniref:FAD-dependent oxidoreductase n=1 Tax=Calditerrivibrio sp. TaxID=2792612 RepID=UPI003D0CF2A0
MSIIGAGPAGLSSAYFLATYGFKVVVYERHSTPGGYLWKGSLPIDTLKRCLKKS